MANAIKKVIRRIRRKFNPPQKLEHPLVKIIAEYKGEQLKQESWERDKKIVRTANFEKAKRALAVKRDMAKAEQERQKAIYEKRVKILKKARKVLAKKRSQDG